MQLVPLVNHWIKTHSGLVGQVQDIEQHSQTKAIRLLIRCDGDDPIPIPLEDIIATFPHPPIGAMAWDTTGNIATVIGLEDSQITLLFLSGNSKNVSANDIVYWQMLKPDDLRVGDRVVALIPGRIPTSKIGSLTPEDISQNWGLVKILSLERPKPQLGLSYSYIPGCGIYEVEILYKLQQNNFIELTTHDKEKVA